MSSISITPDLDNWLEKAKDDPRQVGLFHRQMDLLGRANKPKPPSGFQPVRGSTKGGYFKMAGGKRVYWYPTTGKTSRSAEPTLDKPAAPVPDKAVHHDAASIAADIAAKAKPGMELSVELVAYSYLGSSSSETSPTARKAIEILVAQGRAKEMPGSGPVKGYQIVEFDPAAKPDPAAPVPDAAATSEDHQNAVDYHLGEKNRLDQQAKHGHPLFAIAQKAHDGAAHDHGKALHALREWERADGSTTSDDVIAAQTRASKHSAVADHLTEMADAAWTVPAALSEYWPQLLSSTHGLEGAEGNPVNVIRGMMSAGAYQAVQDAADRMETWSPEARKTDEWNYLLLSKDDQDTVRHLADKAKQSQEAERKPPVPPPRVRRGPTTAALERDDPEGDPNFMNVRSDVADKPKPLKEPKRPRAIQRVLDLAGELGIPAERSGPRTIALGGQASFDRDFGKWNKRHGFSGRRIASTTKALEWLEANRDELKGKKDFKQDMESRRENKWIVRGDTYPHREQIKDAGGVWDRETKEWLMPSAEATAKMYDAMGVAEPTEPTQEQLAHAKMLFSKISRRDWTNSDFGRGTNVPTAKVLESWDADRVDQLINELEMRIVPSAKPTASTQKPTRGQLEYAKLLLSKVSQSDWADTDLGQGMNKPSPKDLESWDAGSVGQLIDEIKSMY